jgi:hypothetical protein
MCMKLEGHKIPKNNKTKTKILNYNCFDILNVKKHDYVFTFCIDMFVPLLIS